jgi:heat shock protein 4
LDIHSVEMIGDATRTPKILEVAKSLFKKPETLRTMNSLETLARGAALQAAILSTNFQVSNFIIEEHNALAVHLQYTFLGKQMRENEIFA